MKTKNLKKVLLASVLSLGLILFIGCKEKGDSSLTLKLAHSLSEDHPVHIALSNFANTVKINSDNEIQIQIYPNAVLGDERTVLEQLQNNVIEMTKVSAASLESFVPIYSVFSLPYIFKSKEHFIASMNSDAVSNLYMSTGDKNFYGLTFYDSGSRSFYTKNKAINSIEDLRGLKIRVQNSPMSIDTIRLLGAAPTPLPYGDIYTAIQQSIIDGAENNITALTIGKHGEVAKFYSYTEHTRVPDILIISKKAYDNLTQSQKTIIKEAAKESTVFFQVLWDIYLVNSEKEAIENLGVRIIHPNLQPFQRVLYSLIEKEKENTEYRALIDEIEKLQIIK